MNEVIVPENLVANKTEEALNAINLRIENNKEELLRFKKHTLDKIVDIDLVNVDLIKSVLDLEQVERERKERRENFARWAKSLLASVIIVAVLFLSLVGLISILFGK